MPDGLVVIMEYHNNNETIVTLNWDPPQGSGPETIVDDYILSIWPSPPYQAAVTKIPFTLWNVTLSHNTIYNINLTAINCAGQSEPFIVLGIEYSKESTLQ